jgi:hypothetical protein
VAGAAAQNMAQAQKNHHRQNEEQDGVNIEKAIHETVRTRARKIHTAG